MYFRRQIIRIIATLVYAWKRKEIDATKVRFLVFTGTVGKTMYREAVGYALSAISTPIFSLPIGYTNELGVLLSLFNVQPFSVFSMRSWTTLLKARSIEGYVAIELGADFSPDTDWFLKRFKPFAVFLPAVSTAVWTREYSEVMRGRRALIGAVPIDGYVVYNHDDQGISMLMKGETLSHRIPISTHTGDIPVSLRNWTRRLWSKPLEQFEIAKAGDSVHLAVSGREYTIQFKRPIFEPQVYALLAAMGFVSTVLGKQASDQTAAAFANYNFSNTRLTVDQLKNGAVLISDTYKAVPASALWLLNSVRELKAKRSVYVLSELRPEPLHAFAVYRQYALESRHSSEVYFVGSEKATALFSRNNTKTRSVRPENYLALASTLRASTGAGDVIVIKGSERFRLDKLRAELVQ